MHWIQIDKYNGSCINKINKFQNGAQYTHNFFNVLLPSESTIYIDKTA